MRRDVQEIFRATPHHKQVMMFSATLAKEIRATCKKFMANVSPIFLVLQRDLTCPLSHWRSLLTMRQNWLYTVFNNTTWSWRKSGRIENWTSSSTLWNSIKYVWFIGHTLNESDTDFRSLSLWNLLRVQSNSINYSCLAISPVLLFIQVYNKTSGEPWLEYILYAS